MHTCGANSATKTREPEPQPSPTPATAPDTLTGAAASPLVAPTPFLALHCGVWVVGERLPNWFMVYLTVCEAPCDAPRR